MNGRVRTTMLVGSVWFSMLAVMATGPVAEARQDEELAPIVPAPEAFRDWPPGELVERLYANPWNSRSFRRAEVFVRPVFFVLTVEWNRAAHKLANQALTDPQVLRSINGNYITVVANADLRPDLRERYQTGSWPSVAFLLPNGQPMLSQANDMGAARPITTGAVGRDALLFLLKEGVTYWNRWSELLMHVGDEWTRREGPDPPLPGEVDAAASEVMARWLLGNADRVEGGFGLAPKFLVSAAEEYAALREARLLPALRRHSRLTLEKLVSSPLFDERDGGMHRLSEGPSFTDIQYEKMLVGNAALVRQLVYSLRGRDSEELRRALAATTGFITRVLARPGGGFYLAQSADPSSPDGGAYWNAPAGTRPAPPLDRLVLSGPNALAGSALMRAGLLLDDAEVVRHATAALELVYDRAYRPGRGVFHVIEPVQDSRLYLVTQADVALAFADAFETTGDVRFLDAAQDLVDVALRNLGSPEGAALRDRLPEPQDLGLLVKERRPLRPNMRIARAMLRLSLHGRDAAYRERALRILSSYSGDLALYAVHGTEGALAIEEAISDPVKIRIFGAVDDPQAAALRRAAVNASWPWTVVLSGEPSGRAGAVAEVAAPSGIREARDAPTLQGILAELANR